MRRMGKMRMVKMIMARMMMGTRMEDSVPLLPHVTSLFSRKKFGFPSILMIFLIIRKTNRRLHACFPHGTKH